MPDYFENKRDFIWLIIFAIVGIWIVASCCIELSHIDDRDMYLTDIILTGPAYTILLLVAMTITIFVGMMLLECIGLLTSDKPF